MSRPRVLVVAGLIVGDDDRILLTQRRPDQSMPLGWELPGGKIEPGESPTGALARELAEELGVAVEVGPVWDVLHHAYPEFDLLMLVYRCELAPGARPQRVEVHDLAWCEAAELTRYDILPADRPLIDRLGREGPPPKQRPGI